LDIFEEPEGIIKHKVLIVDDIEINRKVLASILEDTYECIEADNGATALMQVKEHLNEIKLILLDLAMPKVDGFMFLDLLNQAHIENIPIIIITASTELEMEKRAFKKGAVDYISKPFDTDIVKFRVNAHLNLKLHRDHLEVLVEQNIEKASQIWLSVFQSIADVIENRHEDSGQHVRRTISFTQIILEELEKYRRPGYIFSPKEIRIITEAACFHDIGKIAIPDSILLKQGALTNEEFNLMKTHTTHGYDMAKKITTNADPTYRKHCCDIALYHHEKFDGSGYPQGLVGERIPLSARVVAIADCYDAMVSERSYKKGRSHEDASAEIARCSGKHFDPILVEMFLRVEHKFASVSEKLK